MHDLPPPQSSPSQPYLPLAQKTNRLNLIIYYSSVSGRTKSMCTFFCRILQDKLKAIPQYQASNIRITAQVKNVTSFWFDVDSFCNDDDTKSIHVLFLSTTGEGVLNPDASSSSSGPTFLAGLLDKRRQTLPKNFKWCVFSQGDRSYGENYAAAGRKALGRLTQLTNLSNTLPAPPGVENESANVMEVCSAGYGDDLTPNGGGFRDLAMWVENVFIPDAVVANFEGSETIQNEVQSLARKLPSPQYTITEIDHTSTSASNMITELESSFDEFCSSIVSGSISGGTGGGGLLIPPPPNSLISDVSLSEGTVYDYGASAKSSSTSHPAFLPLRGVCLENTKLTRDEWEQDVRHLSIGIQMPSSSSSSPFGLSQTAYLPGDVLCIQPTNSTKIVERVISLLPQSIILSLGVNGADQIVHITPTSLIPNESDSDSDVVVLPPRWPSHTTLRAILKKCADISGRPSRDMLHNLSNHCDLSHPSGKVQYDKLISLSGAEGSDLYQDYIMREKRNFADVLYDFDSIRCSADASTCLDLNSLLGLLEVLGPRQYSIASSPSVDSNVVVDGVDGNEYVPIHLCVAVLKGVTPLGRRHIGVCSKFLRDLEVMSDNSGREEENIRVWIRRGSFAKLPSKVIMDGEEKRMERPVMFVGSGTGIAPLRGMIRERDFLWKRDGSGDASSRESKTFDNTLVFGCRKESQDYYYSDEWTATQGGNKILRVLTAFSQDQLHKLYVQKVIREADDKNLIAEHLLVNRGALYVAGGAKMARAVRDEVVEAIAERLEGGKVEANKILNMLKRQGLFSIEAW